MCVSVCVCVSVHREISGLEGSRDKRSFRGVSLELLATDVLFGLEIGPQEGLQRP